MNRAEFMERLKQLLEDIPESEREEALQYYNDYFEDAGPENEEKVLEELGSPKQVAEKIKADVSEENLEYSEQGYEDTRFEDNKDLLQEYEKVEDTYHSRTEETTYKKNSQSTNIWKVIAIILLCVILAPVLLPLGIAAVAVVVSVVIAILAVLFGIGIAGFAVLVAGIVALGAGFMKLFISPATGLFILGIGGIISAIGLVLSLLIILCIIKFVPGIIRTIVKIIQFPLRKAGVIE